MNDVAKFVAELEATRTSHLKDIEVMRSMLKVAEANDSALTCGKELLAVCGGDINRVKEFLADAGTVFNGIFTQWYISARLEFLENKGEVKNG